MSVLRSRSHRDAARSTHSPKVHAHRSRHVPKARRTSRWERMLVKRQLMPLYKQLVVAAMLCCGIGFLLYDHAGKDTALSRWYHRLMEGLDLAVPERVGPEVCGLFEEEPYGSNIPFYDAEVHMWSPLRTPRQGSVLLSVTSFMRQDLRNALVGALSFDPKQIQILGSLQYVLEAYGHREFMADAHGHNVSHIGVVESWWGLPKVATPAAEMKWISQLALPRGSTREAHVGNMVPFVNLLDRHEAEQQLRVVMGSFKDKVKSVRFPLAAVDAPHSKHPWSLYSVRSPTLAVSERLLRNIDLLEEYGVAFEVMVFHTQLHQLTQMVERYPKITFVLNHAGGPLFCKRPLHECPQLLKNLERLSTYSNVLVKVSGFGMPSSGLGYHKRSRPPTSDEIAADVGLFVQQVIRAYGVDRVMFGSNFPYDKVSFPYTTIINAYKKVVSDLDPEAQRKLLHENALRVYGAP